MKKLPDVPAFYLVCLAGPAINDNTGRFRAELGTQHEVAATKELKGS